MNTLLTTEILKIIAGGFHCHRHRHHHHDKDLIGKAADKAKEVKQKISSEFDDIGNAQAYVHCHGDECRWVDRSSK